MSHIEERYDPTYQRTYFYDTRSDTSAWVREELEDNAGQTSLQSDQVSVIEQRFDETHQRPYFYNTLSGKSAWVKSELEGDVEEQGQDTKPKDKKPQVSSKKIDLDQAKTKQELGKNTNDNGDQGVTKFRREGYLQKKTSKGKWNSRYFVLGDGKLTYFKSDNKTEVCALFSCRCASVVD
jgi:hypothetical protein